MVGDLRVDVARHGDVDDEERPVAACADDALHELWSQDELGAGSRGDDHICVGQLGGELLVWDSAAVTGFCERLSAFFTSVDDVELGSGLPKGARRGFTHFSGAEEKRATAFEVAEDLLGELTSNGADADGAFGDPGFVPHTLGCRERLRETTSEERAHRAGIVRSVEGFFDLPEDLRLTDDERIQARCDTEDVTDDVDPALLVEDVFTRRARQALRECVFSFAHRLERAGARRVELDPVARGDEEGFFEAGFLRDFTQLALKVLRGYGETLAHLDRRSAMRETDDHEVPHQALPPAALNA